jgi:hypothetical protein
LVAVERNGPVRALPVASDKIAELCPQVKRFVDKDAYLITDENRAYRSIGKQFAAHATIFMKKFTQKMSAILGLLKRPPLSKVAPLPIHCNHMFEALCIRLRNPQFG